MGEGMYLFLLSDDKCKNFDRLSTPQPTFIMIALQGPIGSGGRPTGPTSQAVKGRPASSPGVQGAGLKGLRESRDRPTRS